MNFRRNRSGTAKVTTAKVTCPLEYKGLHGCGCALRYTRTTDNGLIECPRCGLWFAPTRVPARPKEAVIRGRKRASRTFSRGELAG
jgi:hypothetical protein